MKLPHDIFYTVNGNSRGPVCFREDHPIGHMLGCGALCHGPKCRQTKQLPERGRKMSDLLQLCRSQADEIERLKSELAEAYCSLIDASSDAVWWSNSVENQTTVKKARVFLLGGVKNHE
jgi:hypothetical protein